MKLFALRVLGPPLGAAAAALARLSRKRLGVALVYHEISPRGGDPAREVLAPHALAVFEAQLRHIRRHYRPVAAADLQAAAAARRMGGRIPVAVTFDDDVAAHATVAAPALRRVAVPATFFLCGASLERAYAFWWEQLQRAYDRGADVAAAAAMPPGTTLHDVADAVEAMAPGERARVAARLDELAGTPPPERGLRAHAARELAEANFEIGFHTLRHDRLTALDDDALARALRDGRAELARAAGRPADSISYPHGKADARVGAWARDAGFARGFTGVPQPVTADADPLLLGRLQPSHASAGALAYQLARLLLR